MKILIVTPRIPYPPYRGDKLKIFNICKQLLKNNKVHVITFYRNNKDKDLAKPLKNIGIEITLIKLSVFTSLFNTFIAFFHNVPFQVAWYKSVRMEKAIKSLIQANSYDVIYYHLIRTAQFLQSDDKKRLNVLDFTDAVSLYLSRMVKNENNYLKRSLIKSELNRIIIYENIAEKFDCLFVCSEIDKKFLLDKGLNKKIEIIKNGVDTEYFSGSILNYDPKRIIFTGNMPYYANSDAAVYFSKEILPIILKKDPEVKFYIVGQNPPSSIKQLSSENIIVTGYVKDIRNEYLKSAVNVAPMRFGAGTLNKVIESIALGVPVVATSPAIMGLPDYLKKFVFVADNEIDFVTKILEIINHKEIRNQLMKEAQEYILKELSWVKIVSEFELLILNKLNEKNN